MAKKDFDTAQAFDRKSLPKKPPTEAPIDNTADTVTKSVRFPTAMWEEIETAFANRGLNASNGIRSAVVEWLRREQRGR